MVTDLQDSSVQDSPAGHFNSLCVAHGDHTGHQYSLLLNLSPVRYLRESALYWHSSEWDDCTVLLCRPFRYERIHCPFMNNEYWIAIACFVLDSCTMTRMSALLVRFFYKAWFFGAYYYWAMWAFIAVCGRLYLHLHVYIYYIFHLNRFPSFHLSTLWSSQSKP